MSLYRECIVKGCPPEFAQYAKVLEILGDNYFRVKTRSVSQLSEVVEYIESTNKIVVHKNPHEEIAVTDQNLAEILAVKLDPPEVIQHEYEKYIKNITIAHNRLYPSLNELSIYFKKLLKKIIDVVDFPILDITWQIHDSRFLPQIIELDCVHIDYYRLTNITVPIYLDSNERVNFHKNASSDSIIQSSTYSLEHPSMVNVGMYHSVSLIPNTRRVLLQLSYLAATDEIYNKNPSIFKFYS